MQAGLLETRTSSPLRRGFPRRGWQTRSTDWPEIKGEVGKRKARAYISQGARVPSQLQVVRASVTAAAKPRKVMANLVASDFSHLPPPSSSHPPSSSASATELGCDRTPYVREPSLPPVHPPYQHYSDLRTTTTKFHQTPFRNIPLPHFTAHPCYCEMEALGLIPTETTCDECVQECEDGECQGVELTAQCTDQCVVVPCHDTHYGYIPGHPDEALSYDLMCLDSTECGSLNNLVRLTVSRSDSTVVLV